MNVALWIVQILLAIAYGMSGAVKIFSIERSRQRMTWTEGRSDAFIRFVGISEVLGAAGLLLPVLTGILPWLTVLAAIGLSLIQVLAIFTEHLPKKEYAFFPVNLLLLALSVFIAAGRWGLFS